MASISYPAPARGALSLESGVAAFAAAAVGFAVYAMPSDMFADIVAASGLPGFLAAAQPPLGLTARLAAVAAASIVAFGAVWALLRALDRVPARSRPEPVIEQAQEEAEVPRLRRFDAHPDAPARRPIFATRDLGEPEMEAEAEEAVEAEPLLLDEPAPEPEPESEPEPEPIAIEEPQPFEMERIDPAAFDTPAAPPEPAEREQSISNLMRRLEGGLSRRELQSEGDADGTSPVQAAPSHRLRSALSDLQKMSGRG